MLLRIFFDQKNCGITQLQMNMVHHAHQYGPKMRFKNVNRS